MAWLPWAELPARSNLQASELIDWLRYRAIEFKAPAAFIDGIEELYAYITQDERIEELEESLETAEEQRDDLKHVLKNLLADRESDKAIDEAQGVLDNL